MRNHWGMQPQTKITIGEIALLLIIAAEVVIFIGYTKPGHSMLNSLGLTAPGANSMPTLPSLKPERLFSALDPLDHGGCGHGKSPLGKMRGSGTRCWPPSFCSRFRIVINIDH